MIAAIVVSVWIIGMVAFLYGVGYFGKRDDLDGVLSLAVPFWPLALVFMAGSYVSEVVEKLSDRIMARGETAKATKDERRGKVVREAMRLRRENAFLREAIEAGRVEVERIDAMYQLDIPRAEK